MTSGDDTWCDSGDISGGDSDVICSCHQSTHAVAKILFHVPTLVTTVPCRQVVTFVSAVATAVTCRHNYPLAQVVTTVTVPMLL